MKKFNSVFKWLENYRNAIVHCFSFYTDYCNFFLIKIYADFDKIDG